MNIILQGIQNFFPWFLRSFLIENHFSEFFPSFSGFDRKLDSSIENLDNVFKSAFLVQQTFWGKIVLLKSIQFCPFLDLEQKKNWLQQKLCRQKCQNCFVRVLMTFSLKTVFLEKLTLLRLVFHFEPKRSSVFSETISAEKPKLYFLCPQNTLKKIRFAEKCRIFLIFSTLSWEKNEVSRIICKGCHNCISCVQALFWGKTILLKNIQICSSLWASSGRNVSPEQKN